MAPKKTTKSAKETSPTVSQEMVSRKNYQQARMYVQASFNNTIVTFASKQGDTLFWTSTGRVGFKGARKQTPFAATATVEEALKKATTMGIKDLNVYIKGPGPGRDSALRVLKNSRFHINLLADVTPIPHNGPRPKKRRRG